MTTLKVWKKAETDNSNDDVIKKIIQIADKMKAVSGEKQKLEDEIRFLEEENKKTRHFMHQNEKIKEEKKQVVNRIEKLIKKLESVAK